MNSIIVPVCQLKKNRLWQNKMVEKRKPIWAFSGKYRIKHGEIWWMSIYEIGPNVKTRKSYYYKNNIVLHCLYFDGEMVWQTPVEFY